MSRQPLLILCGSFIAGIFWQDLVRQSISEIYVLLVLSALSLILFFVPNFYVHRLRHVSLFLLFFSFGVFAHYLNSKPPDLPALEASETVIFQLDRKLNSTPKNRRYEITAWKDQRSFRSVLLVPREEAELDYKHFYHANLYLHPIEKPYSDFQFDYQKYLSRKDIYYQSYLPGSVSAAEKDSLSLAETIKQNRLETLQKIDAAPLSKTVREFTKGLILADRTEMDKQTVQDFSRSGLVHILAISGSHIAIIFWLILLILKPLFPARWRRVKIFIALGLIWAFAVFIGYGNSVVRSCIMISAYYLYVLMQRKPDLLHAMALAGFIILTVNTNELFDVGFQLSFLAVFGIFWLNGPFLKYLPQPKNGFQNFMVNVVSVSLSAQIATLPLVLFYFHQYSAISIVANLVIIPFSELLIIAALAVTVMVKAGALLSPVAWLYDEFVTGTLKVIHYFAEVDAAYFKMVPMTLPELLVGFAAVYFLRFAVQRFRLKAVFRVIYVLLLFIFLKIALTYSASRENEIFEHYFFKQKVLSVKIGKSVEFFAKKTASPENLEKYIIEPYLTSRRTKVYKLTYLPEGVNSVVINDISYAFD